jgi:hypothetical protein
MNIFTYRCKNRYTMGEGVLGTVLNIEVGYWSRVSGSDLEQNPKTVKVQVSASSIKHVQAPAGLFPNCCSGKVQEFVVLRCSEQ